MQFTTHREGPAPPVSTTRGRSFVDLHWDLDELRVSGLWRREVRESSPFVYTHFTWFPVKEIMTKGSLEDTPGSSRPGQ